MKEHTFIFTEGNWEAHGKYVDQYHEYDVQSEISVLHLEKEWILESYMELIGNETSRYYNKYTIQPLEYGMDHTTWIANNPSLGTMKGKYMVAGDTILSSYQSEDGNYSGFEMMMQVNEDKYFNRGYSFKNDEKLASWEVIFLRTNI